MDGQALTVYGAAKSVFHWKVTAVEEALCPKLMRRYRQHVPQK